LHSASEASAEVPSRVLVAVAAEEEGDDDEEDEDDDDALVLCTAASEDDQVTSTHIGSRRTIRLARCCSSRVPAAEEGGKYSKLKNGCDRPIESVMRSMSEVETGSGEAVVRASSMS
tara:strand:- start:1960 stop:2310 length:351 start_codon:yes stop_codon:yes gene_type:complete